jgi:hypothetical protein
MVKCPDLGKDPLRALFWAGALISFRNAVIVFRQNKYLDAANDNRRFEREARPYLGFKRAQTKNTAMTAIKRVATVSGVFFSESMSKTSGEVSASHELIKLSTP